MATAKDTKTTPAQPATTTTAQVSINVNPELPNLWVDGLNVSAREDNIYVVRFFTSLPEGVFEQTRVITHKEKLKKFVDALSENLDYYPTKKTKPKTKK